MVAAFNCVTPVLSHASRASMHKLHTTSFVHRPQKVNVRKGGCAVRHFPGAAMKIGILYSSVTGNTEEVAAMCKDCLGSKADDPKEISDVDAAAICEYEALVVGAPTWNTGAHTERTGTEWDEFLYGELENIELSDMPVAVFGLGDGVGYGDNFCDAIEEMHDGFQKMGAKMIGYTAEDGCDFSESKSVRDGMFLGLAIDHVNAGVETEDRVKSWCEQVAQEAGV